MVAAENATLVTTIRLGSGSVLVIFKTISVKQMSNLISHHPTVSANLSLI
jgi:hypothetical protein